MKLSEISATLREIQVSPVKTLGQNFLHDRNLAQWIVARAELKPDDYVVEVGPGLGALTEFALASGARVLAIERMPGWRSFCAIGFRQTASRLSTATRWISMCELCSRSRG
jgi:16S rRNA A1518/A1519 N6-dimethyltransferase RsmA/KsgA/DIM1 with predicted DNA glycosylase/AP lyase activity